MRIVPPPHAPPERHPSYSARQKRGATAVTSIMIVPGEYEDCTAATRTKQLQTIQTIQQTNIPVKITFTIQKERKNKNKWISYIRSSFIQRQRIQYAEIHIVKHAEYQRYVPS